MYNIDISNVTRRTAMQEKDIKALLEQVKNAEISIDDAAETLKDLPYKDMGFANIDNHRALRTGYPEVIFCQGKTPQQIRDIMCELVKKGGNIMGTRATEADYEVVKKTLPQAVFFETARIIAVIDEEASVRCGFSEVTGESAERLPTVVVITAGTADIPVAEEAAVTAEILGNKVNRIYDVGVAGIHRLFDKLPQIREADVVIAVAGMEGALASVVGGLVDSPVIAVPTSIGYGANLGGISALLSMLNSCANGVAVVNIDNGFGAAYMAAVINKIK